MAEYFQKIQQEYGDINIPQRLRDVCMSDPKCIYDNLKIIDQLIVLPLQPLYQILNQKDIEVVVALCESNPKLNAKVCNSNRFWKIKTENSFPINQILPLLGACQNNYKCVYNVLAGTNY